MAHFAKLDQNNVVIDVNNVSNDDINNLPFPESEPVGIEFLKNWSGENANWKQTSYNANFRKNYAGIGYVYRSDIDAFVGPQPYPSWHLNEQTAKWEAPVPYTGSSKNFYWDEETQSWIED
jgi:hypothetical protein